MNHGEFPNESELTVLFTIMICSAVGKLHAAPLKQTPHVPTHILVSWKQIHVGSSIMLETHKHLHMMF